MYRILFLLLLPILLLSKYQITVHMPFEAFFIKIIAQNHVRSKIITNSYSPNTLNLKYSDISKIANTKAFFHFGLEVEKKYAIMLKNANPKIKIFDLSKGINKLSDNNKTNPYIWTDPILLRTVAKNIYEALILIDYLNTAQYKYNYDALLVKLDKSFLDIKEKLYESDIYNIFVYDEHWDYFARRFGINLYKQNKEVVKSGEITDLINLINKKDIKAILITNDYTYTYARSISGNTGIPIKTNDIFDKFIFSNMINLSKQLVK